MPVHREIKFGALMDRVLSLPNDYLATGRSPSWRPLRCLPTDLTGAVDASRQGHYAGVDRSVPGRTRLIRSIDPIKDQTYYLSSVAESKLSQVGTMSRRD
jgi:tRNA U34 2-thiouridine synthase MnmA/TrmU